MRIALHKDCSHPGSLYKRITLNKDCFPQGSLTPQPSTGIGHSKAPCEICSARVRVPQVPKSYDSCSLEAHPPQPGVPGLLRGSPIIGLPSSFAHLQDPPSPRPSPRSAARVGLHSRVPTPRNILHSETEDHLPDTPTLRYPL